MGYPPLDSVPFESLWGVTPSAEDVVAEHPDGPHVIVRPRNPGFVDRDAVYDRTTGRVFWAPDLASAMLWTHDGRVLLLIRSSSDENGQDTPTLQRLSWPERRALGAAEDLPLSGPNLFAVSLSPSGARCGLEWTDMGDSGFDIVRVESHALEWAYASDAYVTAPAFSPDDRLFAAVEARPDCWWSPDPGLNLPSEGGPRRAGQILVGLTGEQDVVEVPYEIDVPIGWRPDDAHAEPYILARIPRFVDPRTLSLRLPTGEIRTMDVEASRNDPRWIEAREEKKRAGVEERRAAKARDQGVKDYNLQAAGWVEALRRDGLTCPYCRVTGRDFKFAPGVPSARAVVFCGSCGRSVSLAP